MHFKVHKRENFYFWLMAVCSVVIYLGVFGALSAEFSHKDKFVTYVFLAGFILILNHFVHLFFIGYIKGNAIKINKNQFPDVFEILESQSKDLNLKKTPEIFVLQGNGVLNAFATKFGKKDYVILHSDILELAYQEGVDALSFVIGHELGHIKRKHNSLLKSTLLFPAYLMPFLAKAYSRACEYTCDNIGLTLCANGAQKGILVLASGKQLYKKVNIEELMICAQREEGFSTKFAEVFSTHPHLVKRLISMNKQLDNTLTFENTFYTNRKTDVSQATK